MPYFSEQVICQAYWLFFRICIVFRIAFKFFELSYWNILLFYLKLFTIRTFYKTRPQKQRTTAILLIQILIFLLFFLSLSLLRNDKLRRIFTVRCRLTPQYPHPATVILLSVRMRRNILCVSWLTVARLQKITFGAARHA